MIKRLKKITGITILSLSIFGGIITTELVTANTEVAQAVADKGGVKD